jgi:hypothetical protein
MEFASAVKDSRGRFFVAPMYEPGQIAVFDADGRFLRTIGHKGGGPGEFEEIRRLHVGPGDSLYVSHDFTRLSVFTPELEFKRTWVLKTVSFAPGPFVIRANGQMLALRFGGRGGTEDHPMRTFQPDGTPVNGFGEQTRFTTGRQYAALAVTGQTVWAGVMTRYELDLFDVSGRHMRTLRRTVGWFPAPQTPPRPGPPAALLTDIAASSSNLLWVLTSVASPNAVMPPRPPRGEEVAATRLSISQFQAMREFMLEALDPVSGSVLATLKISAAVGSFIGGDQLYTFRESADGSVTIDISRLRLERQ